MNVGHLLYVLRDAVNYLDAHGQILPNGSVDFANLQNDLGFVAAVETSLKGHGITIPEQVDKIIELLPLAVQLGASFSK